MNARDQAAAWAVDQLDPDNWIKIPEFGVMPQEASFAGFAIPIVHPSKNGYLLRRIVREQCRTARALVRRAVPTLSKTRDLWIEVLDTLDATPAGPVEVTSQHKSAAFYMIAMGELESATCRADDRNDRGHKRCLEALAQSASTISDWIHTDADPTSARADKVFTAAIQTAAEERRRLINTANAKMPRPGRRVENHEDISMEFKRLVRQGHTEREARGILRSRSIASQSTIYRITSISEK